MSSVSLEPYLGLFKNANLQYLIAITENKSDIIQHLLVTGILQTIQPGSTYAELSFYVSVTTLRFCFSGFNNILKHVLHKDVRQLDNYKNQ